MSTTGAIIAGTGTSVTRSTGTAWTNPGNITANDGTNASCNAGSTGSAYLRASNFGFNIPAGSLIQGFTVVFEMAEASTGGETISVQIVDETGAAVGTAKTQVVNNNNAMTAYTLGSGTDVWGTTGITAADINDTDFGVYLWYTTTHNTTVDYISIEVNYEAPISGTLAATESGADTASINGDVLVQGSFAVTESGSDTAAISGTVQAAGVTGSLAATEVGSDTASIQGDVFISGSLAATETGSDTASISGDVLVQGSLNATETGSDTAAISGQVIVQGSLSATETGADTASIQGDVLVQGSLSATEVGQDTAAFSGQEVPPITGTLAATEVGADVASILGKIFVNGSLSATEVGQDTASFSSQAPAPTPTIVGSLGGVGSMTGIKAAAMSIFRLLNAHDVEETPAVKKITKRLKEVIKQEKPRAATIENLAKQAIEELARQEKIAEYFREAHALRQLISELKVIKEDVEDEDEEALLLLA